jgi:ribosomal protein S18 acetylase RimI-like enzyme
MIKIINNLDKYYSFIDSFYEDVSFSDPHLNDMKEKNEDISEWVARVDHYCFVVESNGKTVGLFVFVIYEDEKYMEMLAGLSKDEEAVEEMLRYIDENYRGYHADFVFNPEWLILKKGLEKRGAHFDTEQQRMVYTHKQLNIDTDGIVPYSEKYKNQYIEIHEKDMYWTAEKTIEAKNRFNIFLAVENDNVIGYIDVTNCHRENEPYSLYVKPEYRRKGIGTKLLYKALKTNEPKKMMLFVDVDNIPAIKLYESLGFIKKENANTQTANLEVQ